MPWWHTCKALVNTRLGEAEMISGLITIALLVLFIGAWVWAWNPRRKAEFDAAARLPLDETSQEPASKETQP